MEVRWRRSRRARIVHAHPAAGLVDVPLCGAVTVGPFFNEFPPPPAVFARSRHCRRCMAVLRRYP
ncbi:MAG TPA: hypothetical protein HA263_03125 [Methanoregulaceae archaeon]|nr:hypothetical protein [Methanoregulaceae archaeon]